MWPVLDGLAGSPLPGLGFLGLRHVESVLPTMRVAQGFKSLAGGGIGGEEPGQLDRNLDFACGFVPLDGHFDHFAVALA